MSTFLPSSSAKTYADMAVERAAEAKVEATPAHQTQVDRTTKAMQLAAPSEPPTPAPGAVTSMKMGEHGSQGKKPKRS